EPRARAARDVRGLSPRADRPGGACVRARLASGACRGHLVARGHRGRADSRRASCPTRRSSCHALHLGNHGKAERLHAHACERAGDDDPVHVLARHRGRHRGAVSIADVPRYRHAGLHERTSPHRGHLGVAVALGPRVRGAADRACRGHGLVGEIVVHGPQVFKGYWRQDEATRQAFIEHDGKRFFRTGDLGYYDDEGYFFITDRLKRMINASGFKVWPAEVEAMLYAHPGIQEACVIGAPDGYRGETVKAVIVPRPGAMGELRAEDIIEWARARMAAFKVPRVVEFVAELPKTATGKILWRELQEKEKRK